MNKSIFICEHCKEKKAMINKQNQTAFCEKCGIALCSECYLECKICQTYLCENCYYDNSGYCDECEDDFNKCYDIKESEC